MKTGFLTCVLGSCKGTAIFKQLESQSLPRAIWHLVLLLLISAAVITAGWLPGIYAVLERGSEILASECRAFQFSSVGLRPERDPEMSRKFFLPGGFEIDYVADEAALPEVAAPQGQGLIWLPKRLVYYEESSQEIYKLQYFNASRTRVLVAGNITREMLAQTILATPEFDWKPRNAESFSITPRNILAAGKLLMVPGVFLGVFGAELFSVLLYIGMFVAVFALMNAGRPGQRGVKPLGVLAIYAGFPAIVIGSAGSALRLPFVEFNLVYVFGMTIYLLIIMNRLNRDGEGPAKRDNGREARDE